MSAETWDIGDPEPEGVIGVRDSFFDNDSPENSNRWGRTRDGWKGYVDGGKCYLDWDELVRRFGPVTQVTPAPTAREDPDMTTDDSDGGVRG